MFYVEYLLENLDWLTERLEKLQDHYILSDFPGQVELFTHHAAVKDILGKLGKMDYRLNEIMTIIIEFGSVHLVDAYYWFNLGFYTDVMDISYLLDSSNEDAFSSEDFSLVGFYTLCAGGFVFGGLTEGNKSIMLSGMKSGYHEDVRDNQERWMEVPDNTIM
ncbi:hypothetical protein BDC45DRAFT_501404 [Circinella umbellata]|nr:hypothetical protein BDC45DRAFT_501404 [Circinella umbellata]